MQSSNPEPVITGHDPIYVIIYKEGVGIIACPCTVTFSDLLCVH
jgi:hypothetical protein